MSVTHNEKSGFGEVNTRMKYGGQQKQTKQTNLCTKPSLRA